MWLIVRELLLLSSLCFLVVRSQSYFQNPQRKQLYKASPSVTKGDPYFNDYTIEGYFVKEIVGVQSITICYSQQVDAIQIAYLLANKTLYQPPRHGSCGRNNTQYSIKLMPSEYVYNTEIRTNGDAVDQLSITTYKPKDLVMKKYGPFGGSGKTGFSIEGFVVAFYGSSGNYLSNLGAYYYSPAKSSDVFGGDCQSLTFSEHPDTNFPLPVVRIKKLFIYHEKTIFSIQAQYQLLGGALRLGTKFGKGGGTLTVVRFENDEEILGIEGNTGSGGLCQLSFISRRHNISSPTLYNGPFGWPCSKPFSVDGNILGFSGIAHDTISALGVFYS